MDISHPTSLNYGKHLTAQEVHDLFAPGEDSTSAVKAWLLDAGIDEANVLHYDNRGWLALDLPARHAEDLLKTEYYEYAQDDGSHKIGCDQYSVPTNVSEHIDFVKPGVVLSAPLKKRTLKRDTNPWPHRRPPHFPIHHWPHWQPPPGYPQLPPELRDCAVNIT
jgi:tripeptidyl-peptidase I